MGIDQMTTPMTAHLFNRPKVHIFLRDAIWRCASRCRFDPPDSWCLENPMGEGATPQTAYWSWWKLMEAKLT